MRVCGDARLRARFHVGFEPGRSCTPPWCVRPEGRVIQLLAAGCVPQEKGAAAHVATADERCGEMKPLAKAGDEDVDVLAGGHAAEQDDARVFCSPIGQRAQIALERLSVSRSFR